MSKVAKFNIGDLVLHKQQGYRAIVVDVDPLFQASGRYNAQTTKHHFATRNPWYRLLVDDSRQITYVEESCLEPDFEGHTINNPHLEYYLNRKNGYYRTNFSRH